MTTRPTADELSRQMAADTAAVVRERLALAERRMEYDLTRRYNPQADEDNEQDAYLRQWAREHPQQTRRWTVADWLVAGAALALFLTLVVWATWQWAVGG